MLINYSNHPSINWSEKQKKAASMWGRVVDLSFAQVPAQADEQEIEMIAQEEIRRILEQKPDAVLCQGEFTLTYALVCKLKEQGILVISACSERDTREIYEKGITKKEIFFEFVRFREYGTTSK